MSRAQSSSDLADAVVHSPSVARIPGLNLVLLDVTDSTNRFARELVDRATSRSLPTTAVVAVEQTQGRGRGERSWHSGPGKGVWATWVGVTEHHRLATMPSRVGVALCSAIAGLGIDQVGLKWPNDLVHQGAEREWRKLGGVLCESKLQGDEAFALCGFGVNLSGPGDDLQDVAVGLRDLGSVPGQWTVAAILLQAVHEALQVDDDGWRGALDRYSVHRVGDRLRWHDGNDMRQGNFIGFDETGRLLLEIGGRQETFASGSVD